MKKWRKYDFMFPFKSVASVHGAEVFRSHSGFTFEVLIISNFSKKKNAVLIWL